MGMSTRPVTARLIRRTRTITTTTTAVARMPCLSASSLSTHAVLASPNRRVSAFAMRLKSRLRDRF